MTKTKSVLQKTSIIFCMLFLIIPYRVNSQTNNFNNNCSGLNLQQKSLFKNDNQIFSDKSKFAVGLGAKLFQPPSQQNTDVGISYGITAEFQYIRNDVLSWYINLDYYTASYDYGRMHWILALAGARIYPGKKSFGLNFNIAGGPVFTDYDCWYAMFDLGAGYEIKLNEKLLLNPYICLHLYNESGGESASFVPAPKNSCSIGATVSILL